MANDTADLRDHVGTTFYTETISYDPLKEQYCLAAIDLNNLGQNEATLEKPIRIIVEEGQIFCVDESLFPKSKWSKQFSYKASANGQAKTQNIREFVSPLAIVAYCDQAFVNVEDPAMQVFLKVGLGDEFIEKLDAGVSIRTILAELSEELLAVARSMREQATNLNHEAHGAEDQAALLARISNGIQPAISLE